MSTRCNILVTDEYSKQWFYRHSDGYPSCTAESLKTFIKWFVEGKTRKSVQQGASWLIILGNRETNQEIADMKRRNKERIANGEEPFFSFTHKTSGGGSKPVGGSMGWKVGAYEITDSEHGDIEYLYTIDLKKETVQIESKNYPERNQKYSFTDFLKEDFSKE